MAFLSSQGFVLVGLSSGEAYSQVGGGAYTMRIKQLSEKIRKFTGSNNKGNMCFGKGLDNNYCQYSHCH